MTWERLSGALISFHTVNTLTAATLSNKPITIKRVGAGPTSNRDTLSGRQALGPTSGERREVPA